MVEPSAPLSPVYVPSNSQLCAGVQVQTDERNTTSEDEEQKHSIDGVLSRCAPEDDASSHPSPSDAGKTNEESYVVKPASESACARLQDGVLPSLSQTATPRVTCSGCGKSKSVYRFLRGNRRNRRRKTCNGCAKRALLRRLKLQGRISGDPVKGGVRTLGKRMAREAMWRGLQCNMDPGRVLQQMSLQAFSCACCHTPMRTSFGVVRRGGEPFVVCCHICVMLQDDDYSIEEFATMRNLDDSCDASM